MSYGLVTYGAVGQGGLRRGVAGSVAVGQGGQGGVGHGAVR